jgi:helicase MOV-10
VVDYVKMLINTKFANCNITAKDIGIITPFKQQQLDIIQQLAVKRLEDVTVGTVEIFQGQEKPVIILSTVRSKTFEHNGKEHIGFLSNPKVSDLLFI